jgi:hypothetical protein
MIVHLAELLGHLLVSLGRGVQHRHQVPDDDSPAVVPLTTCPALKKLHLRHLTTYSRNKTRFWVTGLAEFTQLMATNYWQGDRWLRLLAMEAFWVRIQTSLRNTKWATYAKKVANPLCPAKKNI